MSCSKSATTSAFNLFCNILVQITELNSLVYSFAAARAKRYREEARELAESEQKLFAATILNNALTERLRETQRDLAHWRGVAPNSFPMSVNKREMQCAAAHFCIAFTLFVADIFQQELIAAGREREGVMNAVIAMHQEVRLHLCVFSRAAVIPSMDFVLSPRL